MSDSAVKLHVLKGPRVPETTGHPFLCEHFRGTLTGSECLRRQTARRDASPVARDKSPRVPFHLAYCASGSCAQGAEIAAKFPDWKPEERTGPAPNWMSQIMPHRPPPPVEQPEPASVPVTDPKTEEQMAEEGKQACGEPGCKRPAKSKGLCGMHYQRSRVAAKSGKPHAPRIAFARQAEKLTGQDEFDLMIQIRDSFRKLSEPGKLYVLAALQDPR